MLTVSWTDGRPGRDVCGTIAALAGRVEAVYLHFDLDALDPAIAPGIVDTPVPLGLSLEQADELFDALGGRLDVRAAALTTYTPSRDLGGVTHAAALHILERIAERISD